jgi:nucleotide-binding universal stress UspA family protein
MINWKNFLCATDFSDSARRALEITFQMARFCAGRVIVQHVVTPVPVPGPPIGPGCLVGSIRFDTVLYQKELLKAAEVRLRELVAAVSDGGIEVETVVSIGPAAGEIIRLADKKKVDLIVIGAHGHTGFRRWVSGSVAEKVVRTAACSVLTVPLPTKP